MPLLCRSCSSGLLLWPLVFGSHFTVFGVRLWSTGLWIFWEISSECFPYSTLLGLTVDTCLASVYEAFWNNFTRGPSYFSAVLGSTSDSCLCVRLYTSRCALFLVGRPMKLGIMAGMPSRIVMCLAAACTRLVLLVTLLLALFSLR